MSLDTSTQSRIGDVSNPVDPRSPGMFHAPLTVQTLVDPVAGSATSVLNAANVATTLSFDVSVAFDYARQVTVVMSGVGTPVVTITGEGIDSLPLTEVLTATGGTPIATNRAFLSVSNVSIDAVVLGETMNVGSNNTFGLFMPCLDAVLVFETEDGAAPGTPGVLTVGSAAANAEPRGTYTPNSTPDGSLDFKIIHLASRIDTNESV